MTLLITTKSAKDVTKLQHVKAYFFEKMFLAVTHNSGNKCYYKLSDVMQITEEK